MTRTRRVLAAAALAVTLSAALAACNPGPAYSPPAPTSFSPCTPSQGHPVMDKSTGQWRCEP